MPEHSAITDPNIHEPKGVAAATSGQVYVADGAGSGTWTSPLPSQTGNSGKYLTTDGSTASWGTLSGVFARGSVSSTGVLSGSSNITSVTKSGFANGTYDILLDTDASSTNYQIVVTAVSGGARIAVTTSKATTGFTVVIFNGTTKTDTAFDFVVYGG